MKTPREILSQRHSSAVPKLDAIRQAVMAEHLNAPQSDNEQRVTPSVQTSSFTMKLWVELILPCRRFWLATASVWLVVLALDLITDETPRMTASKKSSPGPETLMVLKAQRQLMAQLLEPSLPSSPARPNKPGPRSEQRKATPVA